MLAPNSEVKLRVKLYGTQIYLGDIFIKNINKMSNYTFLTKVYEFLQETGKYSIIRAEVKKSLQTQNCWSDDMWLEIPNLGPQHVVGTCDGYSLSINLFENWQEKLYNNFKEELINEACLNVYFRVLIRGGLKFV